MIHRQFTSDRTASKVSCKRLWQDETGATAVITAITLSVLLGFTALGVEVGSWYAERRALQTAADAAALGAAYKIYKEGKDSTNVTTAGLADASRNGFTHGTEGVQLTLSSPPTTGPNAANEYAAEAIIAKPRSTLISSMFMDSSVSIRTRAVAVVKVGGPFCVLALDPDNESALRFGGTTDLALQNCGLIVNSESSNAMSLIGGSIVGATYADITGNYTKSANSTLDLEEGMPNIGVEPLEDPFEDLDIPQGTGCDYTNFQTAQNNNAWGGAPQPLSPGRYCGGLRVRNIVHMAAGLYVMIGGDGFKVTAGAVVTSDPGVTIFLTGTTGDYAQVDISSDAAVQITAPSSGTYRGVAFFQDRDAPTDDVSANKFNGGSNLAINGAIYIPKQEVQYSGGNESAPGCTKIVANTVEFTGNSNIGNDCTGYGFDTETRRPPKLME